MPTSEAELRVWNRLSVQEKSFAIVVFYMASALFPWITATAVFAFLAGRACGIQIGKMNAEIEQENSRVMRSKIIAELATRNKKTTHTSPILGPIPESSVLKGSVLRDKFVLQREDEEEVQEEIEEEIEEEIDEQPDEPEGEGEENKENKED